MLLQKSGDCLVIKGRGHNGERKSVPCLTGGGARFFAEKLQEAFPVDGSDGNKAFGLRFAQTRALAAR